MKYNRVREKYHGMKFADGYSIFAGELYTEDELCRRMISPIYVEPVALDPSETYVIGGARYEIERSIA